MVFNPIPFQSSYWVVPRKFLAGCYPGSLDKEEAYGKLKGLLDHGIRSIINLMEPDEVNWDGRSFVPYEEYIGTIARSMGETVVCTRMAVRDGWVPPRIGMVDILDTVDQRIEEGKPVFVHCLGGRGRTGTVVGCYLVRHGLAQGLNALDRILELRKYTVDHDEPSPESGRQMDMVLSWVRGE
jgi:hypothetical protein